MSESNQSIFFQSSRVFVLGLVAVVVVVGLSWVILTIGTGSEVPTEERVNALASSSDECVVCHKRTTPGIVEQFGIGYHRYV